MEEKLAVKQGAVSALAVMNDAAGEPRLLHPTPPQPPPTLSHHALATNPQQPRLSHQPSATTPQPPPLSQP